MHLAACGDADGQGVGGNHRLSPATVGCQQERWAGDRGRHVPR